MSNISVNEFNKMNENNFDFKKEFFKYFHFWKIFVASIFLLVALSFFYLRYTPDVYQSIAKIKVLEKNQGNLDLPSAADLFSNTKINIENEIEVIKSYPILEIIVRNLNLTTKVYSLGNVMESLVVSYPFDLKLNIPIESIDENNFLVSVTKDGLEVLDLKNDKSFLFKNFTTLNNSHSLPFDITNLNKDQFFKNTNNGYKISLISLNNSIKNLKKNIFINSVGRESDIVSLNFNSNNPTYSENILNELINVFNSDGIKDKQLIYKRTIDFVNDRYSYLSLELDSIEIKKKSYKVKNGLVNISSNTVLSLQKTSKIEESIFEVENQIEIGSYLINALDSSDSQLLPSNIGIENNELNTLIFNYNESILERNKLFLSAGSSNPSAQIIDELIRETRLNIIYSLKNYLNQLEATKKNLFQEFNKFDNKVINIPENEKVLRSIERNQQIKEALYLFLLQKREEAEVSFAITEPSIKVVEYAQTDEKPVTPNDKLFYLISLLAGLFLPFTVLYLIFLFDTKIHSREDLEKFSFNILGEIPFFDLPEAEKVFTNPDDRSIISESFRMLMSNIRYLLKNDSKSNVVLITSSIKGEGKTLNALNISLSFSSVGKKVLLIGCDLRNPQIHKYINYNKNVPGLVDYLVDNKTEWQKSIINPFDDQSLDILLSGPLPPNPLNLINNGNIDALINDARKIYDYIIIDSAPTLLVADTQSLINKSDVLIFLTRCNITNNDVLTHIKKVSDESETNVGVILNGVGQQNSYGYSYGYRYGYGYNYKYSYNYGYGYGYEEES